MGARLLELLRSVAQVLRPLLASLLPDLRSALLSGLACVKRSVKRKRSVPKKRKSRALSNCEKRERNLRQQVTRLRARIYARCLQRTRRT